jgi:AcrR family transcriptional regulator
MSGRVSAQAALQTRQSVLRAAADLASVEGLENVTIGRLADQLGMSKSGVIGQFRTKERLQLETLDLVIGEFRARVWDPVSRLEAGLPRLMATLHGWIDYIVDPGYRGGCFLTQVTFDFDGRPGAIHDKIADSRTQWRGTIRRDVETAIAAGDLAADIKPAQVVFGLEALAGGVTPARMLHGDADAPTWAMEGMCAILGITDPTVE